MIYSDIIFYSLRTSHAGRYQCYGVLYSPALNEPLINTVDYDLHLTSNTMDYYWIQLCNYLFSLIVPMATVILATPILSSTFHVGSNLTLVCSAMLPETVDTEVTGVVAWDTPNGVINESTERISLTTVQTGNHTHQFILQISSLSM